MNSEEIKAIANAAQKLAFIVLDNPGIDVNIKTQILNIATDLEAIWLKRLPQT